MTLRGVLDVVLTDPGVARVVAAVRDANRAATEPGLARNDWNRGAAFGVAEGNGREQAYRK